MKRQDWTLLALAAAEGEALTPVQLQKTLFLLGQQMPAEVGQPYYEFYAYNYGPFDQAVYEDAGKLEAAGLAEIRQPSGQRWRNYAATSKGLAEAAQIEREVPKPAADQLRALVTWARGLSFEQLVKAVYAQYPEMREFSVFRG